MIPSANTVAREKPPPANRSYRLKRVPCPALRRKSARACTFTPGVAMCAPARYITKQMKVTENFSQRSSGNLNTFSQEGRRNDMGDSGLDGTARLLDLGARGGGNGDALHDELPAHVPHAEKLDGMVRPADQPGAEQRLRRDLDPLGELRQMLHVHHLRRLLEGVREPALGDPADQRHLAALEAGARLAPGASRLPLTTPPGRLADPGAGAAPLANAGAVRATWRLQALQGDPLHDGRRCLRLGCRAPLRLRHHSLLGLRRRHRDEVAHAIEHPAQRRMVRLDHRVLVVLQAERFERAPLYGGTPDPGAPLEDAELALARRGQSGIAPRFPLAVLHGWRVPSHASPPVVACTESPLPRCRAPAPRDAP